LAKLPKFGEPDGSTPNDGFKLPEFTAPKVSAPKQAAKKVAQTKVTAPKVVAPQLADKISGSTGTGFGSWEQGVGKSYTGEVVSSWAEGIQKSPIIRPIISAASAVFNSLGMPLASTRGSQYAQATDNNNGIILESDLGEAAIQGRKINGQEVKIIGYANGAPTYNIQPTVIDPAQAEEIRAKRQAAASQNATAWLRGERTVYGGDLKAASGLDTTPGALGISEAERMGFLDDLLQDPINFIPFASIGKGFKAAGEAGSGLLDAAKLASRGEISQNIAKRIYKDAPEVSRITTAPVEVAPKFRGLGGGAKEYVDEAQNLLDNKLAYKTSLIDPSSSPMVQASAVLGSGLEATTKAFIGSIVRSNADSFLKAYAKRDVTFRGNVRTTIAKQGPNDYRILSGNGEEIARAKTSLQAREMAASIRRGQSGAGLAIKTADDVTKAMGAVEQELVVPAASQGSESVQLPKEAGVTGTIEPFTPYQATDGKWFVYDGNKIYKTADQGAAEQVVDALLWTEANIEAAVVSKVGKGYQVRAGEQIFPAKTKAEADSIANAFNEGTLPAAVATTKGKAVVDAPPSPIALADVLKVPAGNEEGKALKAVLNKLDKVSAKATGTRAVYKTQIKERIQNIIRNNNEILKENRMLAGLSNDLVDELKAAISGKDSNPFAFYEVILKGNPAQPLFGNLRIATPDGEVRKLSTAVASYGKWVPNTPPAAVKVAIESELAALEKRIASVKASGATKVGPQQKYDAIKAEFGEELADGLKATGILEDLTKETAAPAVKSFNAVIDGLMEKAATVKFTGLEDMISQMKNNSVVVDEDSLKQIFKLMDPSNNLTANVEKAAGKESSIYVYNELFKSDGVKTINDMQTQIAQMGDFGNLLKLTGISDDLLLGQLIKDIRAPEGGDLTEFVIQATAKENKQAMAQRVSEADANLKSRVLESIAEANAETFTKIERALDNPEGLVTLNSFGQVVTRSTAEQYVDGSEAVLNRVFNQVRERKMFSVLSALNRNALLRKGGPLNRQKLLDDTIEGMDLASDALGLLDIRITSTKFVDDADFVGAYEKAKAAKKKFDISKNGNFAYLHLGDIMRVFQKTDANDLLLDAFFPAASTSGKKTPRNYLSVQTFSDAARQALEMRTKGKAIDVDQLTARILNSGLSEGRYTASFRAQYKGVARKLAEHMAREDVLEGFSKAHLEKSLGVAERWVNSAESIGKDLERLMYEAWEANLTRGDLDDISRVDMIRSHMRKVLYITDTFRIEGGPIAESAIRAISHMMLKRGLINTPDSADDVTKLLGQQEAASFRKIINTMYLYEKPQFALKPGQTKFVDEKQTGKIQNRLVEAEENYTEVLKRVDDQYSSDPKVRQEFVKAHRSASAKLDRARTAAIEAGIATRHYSPSKGWVATEKFNYEAEARAAQRKLLNYESAKAGLKAREDFIADSRPLMPKTTVLNGKRRAEFIKKQNAELAVVHVENAASRIRNGNAEVEKLMDNNHYENLGATPEEASEMYFQRAIANGIVDNTEMNRVEFPGDAIDELNPEVLGGAIEYGRVGRELEGYSRSDVIREKGYGLGKARKDVAPIARRRETMYHKMTSRYANLLSGMASRLRNTSEDVINEAFNLIKRGETYGPDASPDLIDAFILMERAWRPLIASIENAISTQRGFNGDMLDTAMKTMGLGDLPSPVGLTATELPEYYKMLPFGDYVPSGPKDTDKAKELAKQFEDNKEALKAAGKSPIEVMLRMMQATQNVVFQKGLAEDFVARFSYKAEGRSYAWAVEKEYVKLENVFGDSGKRNLLDFLPEPKDGGLFPPELAKQFFSMNREYNQLFDSISSRKLQGKFFENMMTVIGATKASQTILVPRHHVTNLLGDMSTAMIRGTVNPAHWGMAARVATKFATRKAAADYFIKGRTKNNPEAMERLFLEMFRSFEGEGRVLEGAIDGKKATGIVLYENGKPVRKNLSDDDVLNLFEDWGIIEESIYQEDIQGLVDYLDNTGLGGQDNSIGKKITKGVRGTLRTVTKAPGDIAASYGNIPRVAHAMKLLHGRSWNSVEQAMDTIANEIALFHPTAKSLASTERQWGRFATTYYTWMRMAQMGMLKMIGENTRNVVAIQKVLYEWNREQMGEDNRPINVGSSYGGDLNKMPSYLTSNSGVARVTGANLQSIISSTGLSKITGDVPESLLDKDLQLFFPLMYNDAANYWKADFDPYQNLEASIFSGIFGQAGSGMNPGIAGVLGKNISLIGEPAIKTLFGIDPQTGQSVNINSIPDFFNEFVASNIGVAKPIAGFLDPNLTAEERFFAKFRAIAGFGLMDPQTEASGKNARNQFNKRTKDNPEAIVEKDGAPQPGTALYDRLVKVLQDKQKEQ